MSTDTQTPSRRHRQTRSAVNSSAASNASYNPQNPYHLNSQSFAQNSGSDMSLPVQPTTPPRTPHKDGVPASQNKPNSLVAESGMKNKNRNRNRPKNVNVSPAVVRNDRRTPPLSSAGMPSSKPITTPSAAAYAGPTFHASPAPSALPIPSFYSKSVPDSPGLRGLKQGREVSTSSNSEVSNVPVQSQPNEFKREESPLDIFFKADREERARARSASSAQNAANATGPFQPPASPQSSHTPPASNVQSRPRWSQDKRSSSGGIFALELDSPVNPRSPLGPAFSTPYNERINAARGPNHFSQWQESPIQTSTQSTDKSNLLKAYLFNNQQPQSAPPLASQPTQQYSQAPRGNIFANDSKTSSHTPRNNGRSSGLRQEVTPTKTPTKTPDRHASFNASPTPSRQFRDPYNNPTGSNNRSVIDESSSVTHASSGSISSGERDVKSMEDSLRRILKMDSAGSGAFGSMVHGASGRSPPINGINGVMRS